MSLFMRTPLEFECNSSVIQNDILLLFDDPSKLYFHLPHSQFHFVCQYLSDNP